MVSKPIPLEKTYNTRELGGYPTQNGGKTRMGRFLRSDSLHDLSAESREQLLQMGLCCILDLRTEEEAKQLPCPFLRTDGVEYRNVPLIDSVASNEFRGGFPESMGEMYVGLLKNSAKGFAECIQTIARHPSGLIFFHCAVGKDRTGVLAMLLLSLAGVPSDVILQDYAASAENIRPLAQRQADYLRTQGIAIPPYVFQSEPENIQLAMDFIQEQFGSAENYLVQAGCSEAVLREIKEQFVEA